MALPQSVALASYAALCAVATLGWRPAYLWLLLAAAAVLVLVLTSSNAAAVADPSTDDGGSRKPTRTSQSSEHWRTGAPIAPIDGDAYGLRVPQPGSSISRDPAAWIAAAPRHIGRRSRRVLDKVLSAVKLGFSNGNAAAGTRLIASLEDFYARCHRARQSSEDARRALQTLLDDKRVALRSLQELQFTVPAPLSRPVQEARDVVRADTAACMQDLCLFHAERLRRREREELARGRQRSAQALRVARVALEAEADACGSRRDGLRGVSVVPFEAGVEHLLE